MKILHTVLLLLLLLVTCDGGASTEKPHSFEEVRVHHAYFKNAAHLEQVLGVKFPKSANGKETVSESAHSTTTLDENHILSNILREPNSATTDFSQSPLQVSPNAASQSLLAEKEKTTTESTSGASNHTGRFEVELENDPANASPIASDNSTLDSSAPAETTVTTSESANGTQSIEQTEPENKISTAFTNFSQASEIFSATHNLSSNYSESMIPTSQISTSSYPSASGDHSTHPATIISESANPNTSFIPESADPTFSDSLPSVFPPTSVFNASPFATDSSAILPHRKSKCLMPIRLGVHTSTTTTIRATTQPNPILYSGIRNANITYRPDHPVQFWCKRGTYCPVELNRKTTKIGYKMKSFMLHHLDRSEAFLTHTARNTLTGVPMYTGRNSYQVEFRGWVTNVTVIVQDVSLHNHRFQLVLCRPQIDPFFSIPNTRTVFLTKLASAIGVKVFDITIVSISAKYGGYTSVEFFLNKLPVETCEEEGISSVFRRMEEDLFWVDLHPEYSVHSVAMQGSGPCNKTITLLTPAQLRGSNTRIGIGMVMVSIALVVVGGVGCIIYSSRRNEQEREDRHLVRTTPDVEDREDRRLLCRTQELTQSLST